MLTRWIQGFLQDRRACVRFGDATSGYRLFGDGLPQGCVLAPTLFDVFINDLPSAIPPECHTFLYADDLAVATQATTPTAATTSLQPAVNAVEAWTRTWRMMLAQDKCTSTLFSSRAKEARTELKLTPNGNRIRTAVHPTFLWVKFVRLLLFMEHAQVVAAKAKKRCAILHALSGASWGPSAADLSRIDGYIRPVLEYAGGSWMASASDSVITILDRVQRQAGRIITGCTRDTRCEILERVANLPPFHLRASLHAAILLERAARLAKENNPLAICSRQRAHRSKTGNLRLKVKSWRESALVSTTACGLSNLPREAALIVGPTPPWHHPPTGTISISSRLSTPTNRNDSPDARRATATRTLADLPAADLLVWTDGAADGGISNGGGGVVIFRKDLPPTTLLYPHRYHRFELSFGVARAQESGRMVRTWVDQ